MVLAEVATNYIQLRTFEERLRFAQENAELQRKSLGLADDRFRQGAATELDVRQASANLAQTESSIPPLEAGRRLASNRLCILLGMPASDLAAQLTPAPIPATPVEIAVGIPADLLCRRPDVRCAEREVAAQSAQIGVAEADFYPRLGVNGFIGYAADDLRGLFDARNLTGWIIPSFQWNVLNYGRITNNVRAQDARFQAATLQYQQAVLAAGREVEDALVQFLQAQRQARFLERTVADAQRSVALVTKQFEGGTTDFNRVYTTQSQLVTQQDQLAATRGNIAQYLIQVYRSIGGGWECFTEGCGMPDVNSRSTTVESTPLREIPSDQPSLDNRNAAPPTSATSRT
jgi:NodT family efflux transporter outer membrane factor (OMF) lipoprotein